MREVVLINVSGEDRAGLTAALTEILARYNIDILDIGQAVIHNTLSLGFLVEVPQSLNACPVFKELLFKAHELGVQLRFTPIEAEEYEAWVTHQGRARYIITLLGRQITARHVADVSAEIARQGLEIDSINRLSGRISLQDAERRENASVEFSVRGTPTDLGEMRSRFMDITVESGLDIGLQEDNVYRRSRRLIAFDMDSTLIQAEVIDELAIRAGVGEQVAAITESAMRGEIDFSESFRQRLALLEGLDVSVLESIAESLPITEGADRLMQNLKRFGFKIAIISGGFTYFGEYLQQRWGVDYVHANQLEVVDGKVTGRSSGTIIDGAKKAELLQMIAEKEGISLQQCVAVGDGANDLPMLNTAGLGIAFHAKPIVKAGAKQSISTLGLDGVLYFLGVRDREAMV
ncbi:phosphoserine phosphatase SerB [Solemya pervernicosa gill symbiont]|uniref:Phosphoserine phosphatase n=2 Tax=Gammaproteobacteria incertae sedis TaxID=118884 RepID=A0A1T2L752_9GAMM|nr:phosphoserine phosphatase SerB [Candidatus Reidiella endopervernicosa]OOZ40903.1 phosphoserine phosphatase SerB [Solemya pervernicosa gill symbiont]QKQ26119.1 phosphoserine phosphatase SerB [Candidatus Reidiella endopervernicosa]